MKPEILLLDNYDSFVYNLYHTLLNSGSRVTVMRNDAPGLLESAQAFGAIVISPGPSHPGNAGFSDRVVRQFSGSKCILGVCLGMQIINEVLGGRTGRAPFPVHGKTSDVEIVRESRLFRDLPRRLVVGRYHSLICRDIPSCLSVTAGSGKIAMAVEHTQWPVYGVQFHPESFLTPQGQKIIDNFIRIVCEHVSE